MLSGRGKRGVGWGRALARPGRSSTSQPKPKSRWWRTDKIPGVERVWKVVGPNEINDAHITFAMLADASPILHYGRSLQPVLGELADDQPRGEPDDSSKCEAEQPRDRFNDEWRLLMPRTAPLDIYIVSPPGWQIAT